MASTRVPRFIATVVVAGLIAPAAAASPADQAQLLSFTKSAAMRSNNTDIVNGVPQPGTLLRLEQEYTVRSIPLGDIRAGETIKALSRGRGHK